MGRVSNFWGRNSSILTSLRGDKVMTMPFRRAFCWKIHTAMALLFLAIPLAKAENSAIQWFKDLQQASQAAQQANRPMMIDFWADWCAACKVMDASVYNDPGLITAVGEKLIAVRINFDMQQDLARRYKVEALPHLVFTNSYGTELLHHRGLLEAEGLTAVVRALPADVSEFNRLDRILREDKNHFEALQSMGRQLSEAGFYQTGIEYYEKAVKTDQAKRDASRREAILLAMGSNFLELRDGKKAVSIFERCGKEFPKSNNRSYFLLGLAQAQILSEKKEKARSLLNSLISQDPASVVSHKARELLKSL